MNNSTEVSPRVAPVPSRSRHVRLIAWSAGGLLLAVLLLLVLFRQTEVQAIEHSFQAQALDRADRHVHFKLGWFLLGTARTAGAMFHANDEISAALTAVRFADVSYYRLQKEDRSSVQEGSFDRVAGIMQKRGWSPLLRFQGKEGQVQVFTPSGAQAGKVSKVAFVVFQKDHLVIGSGGANLNALLPIAQKHLAKDGHWPIKPT